MNTAIKPAMIACTVLACAAAVVYALVATNLVSVPKIGAEQAPVAIWYIAAAAYLSGGLLVLRRRRWLWIVGLAANTWVISIFFLAYRQEPEMMLSTAGLATKMAEVFLEAGLIYLLAAGRNQHPASSRDLAEAC